MDANGSVLAALSDELAAAVEAAGPAVVRVDDGTRLTATGIVWSADGTIVSTSHGVERDEDLVVHLGDGTRLPATRVGRDADTDVAALRVEASGLAALRRAPAEEARPGHIVLALGRPGDAGLQATIGIVSARMETETAGRPGYVLYTDAVLYPGFSGGPLLDVRGRGVGLNNVAYGRGRGAAVGLPVVEQVVESLLAHGQVPRGYLGIRAQGVALPDGQRAAAGVEAGLLVVGVEPGSPAEKAGLLLGDGVLAIGGQAVDDVDALRRVLSSLRAGQSAPVRVLRGGAVREADVTLAAQP